MLPLLTKFLRLSAADKSFLLKVMLVVWAVRLMLWLMPFRMLREMLTKFSAVSESIGVERCPAWRIAWAVNRVSRYVPAATCLTQALVTKLLLGRSGHQAVVRIGVARSNRGELEAHAWVESHGKIVIGGSTSSLRRYTPLLAQNGQLW